MDASSTDPVTLALTGMLPAIIIGGALLAAPASLVLLGRYRRAVLEGMAGRGEGALPPATQELSDAPPRRPLAIASFDAHSGSPGRLPADLRRALNGGWRAGCVYAAAGAAFAAVMTCAWLVATRDPYVGPVKIAWLFWCNVWPAVIAINLSAAWNRRLQWNVIGAYAVLLVVIGAIAVVRSTETTALQLAGFWIISNGPPSVLLYAFLARRIRAVGPMVLAFAIIALLGSQLALSFIGASDARMREAVQVGSILGMGGNAIFWLTFALGLGLFAGAGFVWLKWLGRRYAAKRFSDESLTIDSVFLLFAITQSFGLVFEYWTWIVAGPVGFVAYFAVRSLGFRRLDFGSVPRSLLLLRVFALGTRSERLFDALRKRWLRAGSVALIAGPDLVTSTVEPDEFLGFLSGDLGRQFVTDDGDLDRRMRTMDRARDPDGRFRISEFFCYADTWQATMRRLVTETDGVLMDLRSFSPTNQGCLYEVGTLLETLALDRVVFVVDPTTDRPFLEANLMALWKARGALSPSRALEAPTARLFATGAHPERDIDALLEMVYGAESLPAGPAMRTLPR